MMRKTKTKSKIKTKTKAKTKPITVTAYARHRKENGLKGGTHQAVKKAIDSARLLKSVVDVGKKKMIVNAKQADKEWESKTTPDTQTDQNDEEQLLLDIEHKETSKKYTSARARRLDAQAELAEIELSRAKGEVLDLNKARIEITTIGKELVQGLINISRTQAAQLANDTNAQSVRLRLQNVHKKLITDTIKKFQRIVPDE